nr:rod shape-determining protein MreC [Bacteroidota bacterium]
MKNLITFLWKYYFFFLFLSLEVVAVLLIVKNNYYQRTIIINSTNDVTGAILKTSDGIIEYFHLKKANQILAEENVNFRKMLPQSFLKTDTATFFRDDTLYNQQYTYLTAKVISNTTNRINNFIKLNKGKNHGIEKHMAVLAPDGIVGQVIEVSDNYASVMSVLNSHTRISAKLKSSGQVGTLIWNGENYRLGKLVDIPTHVQIQINDSVFTSGYSYMFPEGQLIGTVSDYELESGQSFYQVDVVFSCDYNNLRWVYVVRNLMQKELNLLDEAEEIF